MAPQHFSQSDRDGPHSGRRVKIALLGAGLVAGAIATTAFAAGAQPAPATSGSGTSSSATASSVTTSASANSSSSPPSAPQRPAAAGGHPGGPPPGMGGGGTTPAASIVAALKAAAVKAVPGGTVDSVRTGSGSVAYVVQMTKSDGSHVSVQFDKNLKVIKVVTGPTCNGAAMSGAAGGRPGMQNGSSSSA